MNIQQERHAAAVARKQGEPPVGTAEKVIDLIAKQERAKAMSGWKPLTIVQQPKPLTDDEMRQVLGTVLAIARQGRR